MQLGSMWGHPHNSTSPSSLSNAPADRLQPLRRASKTALFKPSPSQAKVLTGGGDLREAQVDVPLSVSHSCV